MEHKEEEVNQIRELINKARNTKGVLSEMSYPRKVYKNKVDFLIPQVLENWCLVRYCTLTGKEDTKPHWQGELRGHMLTIARYSIKVNDSEEVRLKVFDEIWSENDYSDLKYLNLTVNNKMYSENIDTHSEVYHHVLSDCTASSRDLINVILTKDADAISAYVKTI